MRRKSERNKAKSSPEKKPEKPTRKSTRRRTKKSPSTSPERLSNEKEQSPCKRQTRLRSKERTPTPTTTAIATTTTAAAAIELMTPVIEETEAKVSSTELLLQTTPKKQDDIDDGGSVWKVARADASPGQIQKLKICRQRNLSETSDVSLSKKRSNKWQEYGEGADSADEPPTLSNDGATIIDNNHGSIDDTSSSVPGRESGEEVSDSKEIPSEITTVDISDVKKNIDKQLQPGNGQGKEKDHDKDDDDGDDGEDNPVETTTTITTANDSSNKEELVTKKEVQSHDESHGIEKSSLKPETEFQVTEENQRNSPTESVKPSVITDDKNIEIDNKETEKEEKFPIVEKEIIPKEESLENKASPFSSDNENNDNNEKINKKRSDSMEKSNDESKDVENITTTSSRSVRLTRRKHRDKYRGSSNSESGDSDDEPRCRRERSELNKKKEEESKSVDIEVSESLKDVKSPVVERDPSESPSDEHLDIHADTDKENDKDKSSDVDDNDDSNKKTKSDNDEAKNDQVDKCTSLVPTIIYKPAKVSLKRSFSRASVDTKKEDADTLNDPSQDKENHVSEVPKIIPKRRRWGTSALNVDTTPVLSISTDSLQALVPGAKPLSMSEVRLTKDDDETRERRRDYDKRHETNNIEKVREDTDAGKNDNSKDNHSARRKVSVGKDTLTSPSPPSAQLSSILFIKNLVRPFTMTQLKELLFRTGTIVEDGFWMDRIKSKAYVEYMNEDQAFETRQALHGISWPPSNPKKLIVEYATREAMNEAKELSKDQLPSRKVEATSGVDGWPHSWDRDEKSNSTTKVVVVREWDLGKEDDQHLGKDKERDKKDNEKKRRQRSRSPMNDAHLPAPARKFKKKEDDAPPAKLLDDLFKKTKATPCIYWLPLTNEQIVVKKEMRRKAMADHAQKMEELRRDRYRDNRRRRSPRK